MNDFLAKIEKFLEKGIIPSINEFPQEMHQFFNEFVDLKFLTTLLKDPEAFEIMFHCDSNIEIRTHSKRVITKIPYCRRFIDLAFKMNALKMKTDWNQKNYQVSYKFIIGSFPVRITLLHKVVQNSDHKYFIRKREIKSFPLKSFNLPPALDLSGKNIIIAGSTGSGKTSFLNAMIQEYYSHQHHVILEDTREIQVDSIHTTYLCSAERLEEFCANAMRLSPSNLILGEIRSSEVVPFTLLLTSGHQGLLSTIHANSALDAIERIALLYSLYARNPMPHDQMLTLLCKNIDLLIFIQDKKIHQIVQIKGHKNGRYLYENIGQIALSEAV